MTTTQEELAAVAATDRDAVIYWIRDSESAAPVRQAFAHKLMLASVFTQAHMEGLVDCARCGDRGCGWCKMAGAIHGPVALWGPA